MVHTRHPSQITTAILLRDCIDDLKDRSALEPLAPTYEKTLKAIFYRIQRHERGNRGVTTDSVLLHNIMEAAALALKGRL